MRDTDDLGDDLSFGMPSPSPEGTQRMKAIIEKRRGSEVSDAEAEDALRRVISIVWHLYFIDYEYLRESEDSSELRAQKGKLEHEPIANPNPCPGTSPGTTNPAVEDNHGGKAGGWPSDGQVAAGLLRDPG